MDPVKITGGNGNRRKNDFYPTPKEATQALIDFLELEKTVTIWEPAAGKYDIVHVLEDNGYKDIIATDIITGTDFLNNDIQLNPGDWIITNPPFSLSSEFIKTAFNKKCNFAFLLKAQYWNSKKRYTLFYETKPAYVLPLTWRPDFTGQKNSLMDCIWCVWFFGYHGETVFKPLLKGSKK